MLHMHFTIMFSMDIVFAVRTRKEESVGESLGHDCIQVGLCQVVV